MFINLFAFEQKLKYCMRPWTAHIHFSMASHSIALSSSQQCQAVVLILNHEFWEAFDKDSLLSVFSNAERVLLVRISQQVKELFVVDLHKWTVDRNLDFILSYFVEEIGDASGNNASLLGRVDVGEACYGALTWSYVVGTQELVYVLGWPRELLGLLLRVKAFAKHGVGLARACLAIGKDGAVEASNNIIDAFRNVVEDLILCGWLSEDSIVLQSNVMRQICELNNIGYFTILADAHTCLPSNVLCKHRSYSHRNLKSLRRCHRHWSLLSHLLQPQHLVFNIGFQSKRRHPPGGLLRRLLLGCLWLLTTQSPLEI